MEQLIQLILDKYPYMDYFLAETMVKLHEQGKLSKIIEETDTEDVESKHCIIKDSIKIEN